MRKGMKMADQIVKVYRNELEAGSHICRAVVSRTLFAEIVLPFSECSEARPDWGVYSPVVTFPAVERTLRRRGVLPTYRGQNEEYMISVSPVA